VYYQNIRGVNGIVNKLYNELHDIHFDVVCLTETFLKPQVLSSEIFPLSRYETFRSDRMDKIDKLGGGVILGVKHACNFRIYPVEFNNLMQSFKLIDIVGIDIQSPSINATIVLTYIPPHVPADYFELFLNDLSTYLIDKTNILIMGDFNVRSYVDTDLNQTKCRAVVDFFKSLNITQINKVANCDDVLLDLVAATPELNGSVSRETDPLAREDGYHPSLSIELTYNITKLKRFPTLPGRRSYNYRKANLPALYNAIFSAEWLKIQELQNVNEMPASDSVTAGRK